jgi:alkylation response protein AidB-like acyl-CoA dehydrogenase
VKFDLSEDQQLLRSSTVELLAAESPIAVSRQISEMPGEGFSRAHWRKLAELGYLGLVASEEAGGQGMGAVELAIVCEEMGKVCFAGPYLDVVLAARVLEAAAGGAGGGSAAASPGLKAAERWLDAIVRGEAIVVLATADRVWPSDRADVAFAGGRVTGTKHFVPFAASADALLVSTPAGLVLAEGPFRTEPMETVDEATRFARVVLDNPAEKIGDVALLDGVSTLAEIGSAADALGVCQWALEASLRYASERRTFGKPIGAYQVLQHRMADMLVRTESSRAAVYRAAWYVAAGAPEAALAAASAKAYAVESATRVTRDTVQIHGGNGFTWEFDVHRYLKRAMTLEQHYGRMDEVLERALVAFEASA